MRTKTLALTALALGLGLTARANLELWLPFNTSYVDGSGLLISPDASGNGRHAYLNLAATNVNFGTSGASILANARAGGGALQLDGINDFARVLDWSGISGGHARTISLWVKQPATTTNPNDIWVGWGDPGAATAVRWDFGLANSSSADMRLEANAKAAQSTTGATIADDTWHMATVTYEAGANAVTFYLDGSLFGSVNFNNATPINTVTTGDLGIIIGAGIREATATGNANRFVNGLLDDVRIYSTALSATEVQDLYLLTIPEPSSLALLALGGLALFVTRRRR